MKCAEFREWMAAQGHSGTEESAAVRIHARSCPTCARLLRLDQAAEQALQAGLVRVDVPAGLRASVGMIAGGGRRERKRRWALPWLAAPGFALAVLVLLVLFPFERGLTSIDRIARLAQNSHLAGYAMQFHAGEVSDLPGWFRDKLAFEVREPDLAGRGLVLLGGRKCSLGGEAAAYLFYEKNGKPCSFFQLDAKDVRIDLAEGTSFRYPVGRFIVEVWKEGDRVNVLIV